MKRLIVLLVFAVFGMAATNAQTGYQSFLNGDTIQWNINNFSESRMSYYVFYATDTFIWTVSHAES